MITIHVKINGREIAVAGARNVSDLAGVSDYIVTAKSDPSPITGLPEQRHSFDLRQHPRLQSAWALVSKIAAALAAKEHEALMLMAHEQRAKELSGNDH